MFVFFSPSVEYLLGALVLFITQAGEGSSDYQRVVKALLKESLKRAYQEIETRLAEVCCLIFVTAVVA